MKNCCINLQNILVTTYKSAKGLEFDTVIMPELENLDDQDSNQYYVGAYVIYYNF